MVDTDLAEVYGVPTKRLNEQVKRNAERFPEDFAFRLTLEEKMELVAKCDRFSRLKHSTAFPLVFTEHGAIMAALDAKDVVCNIATNSVYIGRGGHGNSPHDTRQPDDRQGERRGIAQIARNA